MPLFGQHLLPAGLVQRGSIFPFVVLAFLPAVFWYVGVLTCNETVGVVCFGLFVVFVACSKI